MPVEEPGPTAIDLFAGAGGLSQGLENAGFNVLVANEVHPDPCRTYRENHDGVEVVNEDIREISARDLVNQAEASADRGIDSRGIDLVAGGPPCQGFSTAGEMDREDPRNNLYKEFARMVDEIRPRAFIMENVSGLKHLYDGKVFENIIRLFDSLDYKYGFDLLDALDFGAPQHRERLFFIGYRDDLGIEPRFPESWAAPGPNQDDSTRAVSVTIAEAVSDISFLGPAEQSSEYSWSPVSGYQELMRESNDSLHNHVATNHTERVIKRYSALEPGMGVKSLPEDLRTSKVGTKRWHPGRQSRTITTLPNDFVHYNQPRIPTVREMARIQTFPDDYVFLGQRTAGNQNRKGGYCSQTQQVGNAVPPWLGEAVGRQVLAQVRRAEPGDHSFFQLPSREPAH